MRPTGIEVTQDYGARLDEQNRTAQKAGRHVRVERQQFAKTEIVR